MPRPTDRAVGAGPVRAVRAAGVPLRPLAAAAAALVALALAGCSAAPASSGAPIADGAAQVNVTLTSASGTDTCTVDHASAPAGPITFTVTNTDSTAISELELLSDQRIIGEKENLAPGLPAVSFTLTLDGGDYQFSCPGGSPETVPFTVTGTASTPTTSDTRALLQQGAQGYAGYVSGVLGDMVTAVGTLNDAVASGDLAAAQQAYAKARPFYEKVESDVDGFVLPGYDPTDNAGFLDYLVDMRASNLDPKVGWHGFHAVERDLFKSQKITSDTKKLAAELLTNVTELAQLSSGLTYAPEDLANGAAGLLEEVMTNKISGEEESYSHIDLVDFAANVEGAEQAFAFLKPGLEKIDPQLTSDVASRFDAVTTLLDTYRDSASLGGYKAYTAELKASDASKLSAAVQALQEPLSTIAEKVATAA